MTNEYLNHYIEQANNLGSGTTFQGISDEEIANRLKEQRISPKEINEALSQSEIKSEITKREGYERL